MEDAKDEPVIPIKVSINSMLDLITRIDERVLLLKQDQKYSEEQTNENTDNINELMSKVKVLELESQSGIADVKNLVADYHNINLRLQSLESNSSKQELRWKGVFTFVVQLIWVILAAYLLYKLGIQSPEVP